MSEEHDCYVQKLGGSFVIRYAPDGSLLAFRPDRESAEEYAAKFRETKGKPYGEQT